MAWCASLLSCPALSCPALSCPQVVCMRETLGRMDASRSLLLQISLPGPPPGWEAIAHPAAAPSRAPAAEVGPPQLHSPESDPDPSGFDTESQQGTAHCECPSTPSAVGWEPNAHGKLAARCARAPCCPAGCCVHVVGG